MADLPIIVENINAAEDIFGPKIGSLKKTQKNIQKRNYKERDLPQDIDIADTDIIRKRCDLCESSKILFNLSRVKLVLELYNY